MRIRSFVRLLPSTSRASAPVCTQFSCAFAFQSCSFVLLGRSYGSVAYKTSSMPSTAGIARRVDIVKSASDARLYRGLELSNGMRVVLVHDPAADKAAAALNVGVGHLMDPRELPGLAHFCEHMLFLGTAKFPGENDYSKFLQGNGGAHNAYTASDCTNYFFDIAPNKLEGAIERFAQFFLTPLFTESATEREVMAVDSENANNLQNDGWRSMQLERSLSNAVHDYSKFGTGNRQTLMDEPKKAGIETREALLKFHKQWYSSNIMGLCIVGSETLDEMEEKFVLPYFAEVENKEVENKRWLEHPYGADESGYRVNIVPVKDMRQLKLSFPLGDERPHYRSKPSHYISHLIGHEGPGSLLSELKRRGWTNGLSSGGGNSARGFGFFQISMDLSEDGMNHIDEIVELIYEYIGLLREVGVQEWIHRECQQLSKIDFRFKETERAQSLATTIAGRVSEYELDQVLEVPYIMDEYKPRLIDEILESFKPENMTLTVMAQLFAGLEGNEHEKWYNAEYNRAKIAPSTMAKYTAASRRWKETKRFALPERNLFIPSNFEIAERERKHVQKSEYSVPRIVTDTPLARLWFLQDDEFLLPKCVFKLHMHSPLVYSTPAAYAHVHMLIECLDDSLAEYTYDASLAGLRGHFSSSKYGVQLTTKGYNEKLPEFTQKLLEHLRDFTVDRERFDVLKELYVRGLRNFAKEQPYQLAVYDANVLLGEKQWTNAQLLECAQDVTADGIERVYLPSLLAAMHFEVLVHGNATESTARDLMARVTDTLKHTRPIFATEIQQLREVQLPAGTAHTYSHVQSTHANSCLHLLLQTGVETVRDCAVQDLLCQIMSEPAFDTLRTKEQLGYIVFSGVRLSNGTMGVRVIVQGGRHPKHVEARVDRFLGDMGDVLETMGEGEFDEHRQSLITKRAERPKRLSALAGRHWSEIRRENYSFDNHLVEIEAFRALTKADVIDFYKRHVGGSKQQRLAIRVYSAEHADDVVNADGEERCDDSNASHIADAATFKMAHSLYGHPTPYMTDVPPKGRQVHDEDRRKGAKL